MTHAEGFDPSALCRVARLLRRGEAVVGRRNFLQQSWVPHPLQRPLQQLLLSRDEGAGLRIAGSHLLLQRIIGRF